MSSSQFENNPEKLTGLTFEKPWKLGKSFSQNISIPKSIRNYYFV